MSEPPPPTSPLNYATPYPTSPTAPPAKPRGSGRLLGWIFFIALAVFVLVLVQRSRAPLADLPLSRFVDEFRNGNVRRVTIQGDQLRGEFIGPQALSPTAGPVQFFRTDLPAGTAGSWAFTNWLLENRGKTVVDAENDAGPVSSYVLPLIPWIVIVGVLWLVLVRVHFVRPSASVANPGLPQRPIEVVIVNREVK